MVWLSATHPNGGLEYHANQGTFVCVSSNRRPDPRLRIRRAAFNERKAEVFGDLPWYEVAEKFGLHPSTMSLLRQGHVQPQPPFIADTLRFFGGKFEDWFEVADQAQGSAA
jgi:hypothetical protein